MTDLSSPLRLATRSSPLALRQVDLVAACLASTSGAGAPRRGVAVEVLTVETAGDISLGVPIHAIGGRGVFVKEVDDAVLAGRADASVHSAKDLPASLADGLVIAAYLPRGDPRDALVGLPLSKLRAGAVVASGSVRRRAQLGWIRPDLRFVELRGNMATRLSRVPPGGAAVVAMAALARLGLGASAAQVLSVTEMLPQVGQGTVAVCCRAEDSPVLRALQAIDDPSTRAEVESERAWLRAVGGGCDAPVGAHAHSVQGELIHLEAMIASLDGHVVVRDAMTGPKPETLGLALAARLLDERGGRALLDEGGLAR